MRTRVYLTVDTETSIGGAWSIDAVRPVPLDRTVYCRIGGRDYGIGWICDQLNQRGMQATFFCETLCSLVLGDAPVREYLQFLLAKGQDVQLHVHPTYYFYAQKLAGKKGMGKEDRIMCLAREVQRELLAIAREKFMQFTGQAPIAYRAGNFAADLQTLDILSELGFAVDSSLNGVEPSGEVFRNGSLPFNTARQVAGLWELPIMVANEHLPNRRLKYIDVISVSAGEMRSMLRQCRKLGIEDVVIVFHSFSFIKKKDFRYDETRPDHTVMNRFESLLSFLAANAAEFEVATMAGFAANPPSAPPPAPKGLPDLGLAGTLARKAVQLYNRPYSYFPLQMSQ
ncbi:MAG: hypothetical protein IT168_26735 [Bryobacterales bacterium]|nr:hypothetical protein [Bryobacterales bacterium]